MYQEKKRERRRRDYLRMKERARKIQANWWDVHHTDPDLGDTCGKLADNLAICSCWRCGNPRKWNNELTIQEKKALQYEKYDVENL